MMPRNPPAVAVWMVEHLTFADRSQALAGDLWEEFRSGRSTGWYWRQALIAVAIGISKQLRSHVLPILFAAVWALPAPVFQFYVVPAMESALFPSRWTLSWPYSTICDIALALGCDLLYVWTGLAVCFLLSALAARRVHCRAFPRALWISAPVLFAATAAAVVLAATFHPGSTAVHHLGRRIVFVNSWISTSLRIDFFLALLVPLWMTFPITREETMSDLQQE